VFFPELEILQASVPAVWEGERLSDVTGVNPTIINVADHGQGDEIDIEGRLRLVVSVLPHVSQGVDGGEVGSLDDRNPVQLTNNLVV